MPTVECVHSDCQYHGIEICVAKRVHWDGDCCLDYRPKIGKQMLDAPFNSNCRKDGGGKYKSSRVTKVLK